VRKIWNGKKKCISVLVLAAMVFAMAFTSAYGASGIDTKAAASITLGIGDTSYTELPEKTITVSLYKVADVQVSGKYKVVETFSTDSKLKNEIENVSSGTTADDWKAYAAEAAAIVGKSSDGTSGGTSGTSSITPDYDVTITGGNDFKKDVAVGLYLAVVDPVKTKTYQYTAAPFLIAVPGNNYGTTMNGEEITDDEWIYDVKCNIKFGYEDRYGDLTITKNLENYNASLGTATFVYEVTAVKDYSALNGGEKDEKTVYNNVVTIDFSKAGDGTAPIKGIPAGAEVTVKEVYSGASYKLTSAKEDSTTIVAGKEVDVSFKNDYDDSLLYQDTIVNSFSHESGTWEWAATRDGVTVLPRPVE
jgi:hypothetical protein